MTRLRRYSLRSISRTSTGGARDGSEQLRRCGSLSSAWIPQGNLTRILFMRLHAQKTHTADRTDGQDKRLQKYYLNGSDAFRLKLWLRAPFAP